MNIPKNFQIFERPVVIEDKDAERLSYLLRNWLTLHQALLKGVHAPDLERLLVMELMGFQRVMVCNRLAMRLSTLYRQQLRDRVRRCRRERLSSPSIILERALKACAHA